ncbi:MAG: YicC/YloC family endoribonuclease [Candidatus Glassbacteria bacterium]
MISSMTGFGRGEAVVACGTFTVEIRTVNHRYIDFAIRTPRVFSVFEPAIKDLVKSKISRGYINYQLTWEAAEENTAHIVANDEVIRRYLDLFEKMGREYGIEGKPTVDTFSRLPDVFKSETVEYDESQLWQGVEQATSQALEALVVMRRREGNALAADLLERLDVMAAHMESACLGAPDRLKKLADALREKILAAVQNTLDENRLMTEITYYADKWDFSEEDVRFRTHLGAMRETITAGGVVGRRLNFMLQELNREANTVGSKANDAEIAQLMVGVKEELERVREQVENIE